MAKEFRHARFGLVPASFTDQRMEGNEQILKSFLKGVNGFNLINNAESHIEVFTIAKEYIGDDFRSWLYVNYRSGSGARKDLVRAIVGYVNGNLSIRNVTTQMKIDLGKIAYIKPGKQIQTPIIYDEYDARRDGFTVEDISFNTIQNRNIMDLFAAIGPELTAKFCLSIDGVYYG